MNLTENEAQIHWRYAFVTRLVLVFTFLKSPGPRDIRSISSPQKHAKPAMWSSLSLAWIFCTIAIFQVVAETASSTFRNVLLKRTLSAHTHPLAVCNDGTQAFFYYSSPERRENDKWMVYFESGRYCADEETCKERPRHWTTSSDDVYPPEVLGTDLFARGENEPFNDFHHVYVGYCTSDLYLARRVEPLYTTNGKVFLLRGAFVVHAVFKELEKIGLNDEAQIVMVGSSAGGLGALNYAIEFRQRGKFPNLALIVESAWFINHDGIMEEIFGSMAYRDDITFAACNATVAGTDDLPCCFSAPCLANNFLPSANIPSLFITSSSDIFILGLLIQNRGNHTQFDFSLPSNSITEQTDYYTGAMNASLIYNLPRQFSLFQVSCAQHVYFRNINLWPDTLGVNNSLTIDADDLDVKFTYRVTPGYWKSMRTQGVSLESAVTNWLASNYTPQRTWDRCVSFICNPSCPDSIKSTLKVPDLPRAVETLFTILAVAILAAPAIVKTFLSLGGWFLQRKTIAISQEEEEDLPPGQEPCKRGIVTKQNSCISIASNRSRKKCLRSMLTDSELQLACANITVYVPLPRQKKALDESFDNTWEGLHGKKAILKNITVEWRPKQLVGIMGPSGSGKTTFLHILANRTQGYHVEVCLLSYFKSVHWLHCMKKKHKAHSTEALRIHESCSANVHFRVRGLIFTWT